MNFSLNNPPTLKTNFMFASITIALNVSKDNVITLFFAETFLRHQLFAISKQCMWTEI